MASAGAAAGTPSWLDKSANALGVGALKRAQLDVLQSLVTKHLVDPSLAEIANTKDFTATSLERGIPRYEHAHLVAALDVILAYQRERQAKGCGVLARRKAYRHDPRTRFCELLKRWLRTHAANVAISEDEVRRMSGLCRDVLNYPRQFPSRNPRSFMQTMAEVFDHVQLQLKEVLKRDRSCAELAASALSISRNLIADAISYLLLAATDLKQTDRLPSLEVVALWQTLPAKGNPLPGRADMELQNLMQEGWKTLCGSLVASLLSMPWAFRLFGGASAQDEAAASGAIVDKPRSSASDRHQIVGCRARSQPPCAGSRPAANGRLAAPPQGAPDRDRRTRPSSSFSPRRRIAEGGQERPMPTNVADLLIVVEEEFNRERFGRSGLAGPFREREKKHFRKQYLEAIKAVYELMYLLGEVMVHFQRISEGLGDYGMIRVASWLHPFLEALVQKVQRLKTCLEAVNTGVDEELVIAKARGRKIRAPAPTERMSARAHASIERAVTGRDSHVQSLLQVLEDLRARSAPERLPVLMEDLGDACMHLETVLASTQFKACVGDQFPRTLPSLRGSQATLGQGSAWASASPARPVLQVD